MSRAFHKEWRSSGVRSILIAPGSMKTRMGKKVKNQKYKTFINPVEVANIMRNLLFNYKNLVLDEIKMNRMEYK